LDDSGAYGASLNNAFAGDAKEREKRRIAAEKELRRIFERTYGPVKEARHRDARESDFRKKKPELSEEEAAWNAARNEEIRAKHMQNKHIQNGGSGRSAGGKQTDSGGNAASGATAKGKSASPGATAKGRSASPGVAAKGSRNEEEIPLILIDGYNLIFADQYLTELADRDVGSARDQLLERLCNYAAYTGCEMTVVFDAYKVPQGTGSEEDFHGVKVIYTAENEPADIRMGLITGSLKKKEFYVVSSDSLVQQDAWGHGALRISSHEFMHLLSDTEQEIRSRL
jgi:predicted RNA-binding protein with PIN domain